MAPEIDDVLRLVRKGCSLRLKASETTDVELHTLARSLKQQATLHIVMDRKIKIEDAVQIGTAAQGIVLFDHA